MLNSGKELGIRSSLILGGLENKFRLGWVRGGLRNPVLEGREYLLPCVVAKMEKETTETLDIAS